MKKAFLMFVATLAFAQSVNARPSPVSVSSVKSATLGGQETTEIFVLNHSDDTKVILRFDSQCPVVDVEATVVDDNPETLGKMIALRANDTGIYTVQCPKSQVGESVKVRILYRDDTMEDYTLTFP